MQEKRIQPATWFEKKTKTFQLQWELTPWQEGGERKLSPLKQSLRKYASHIHKLPENFLPMVFDQYLAVLSERYEYHILDVIEELGDDRFHCRNAEGEDFYIWSKSISTNYEEGSCTVLTALIRLEDEFEESLENQPTSALTYGPILGWQSLFAVDFSLIARALRRDLFRLKGSSAVIRQDPVPFWALWTVSAMPQVMQGSEELCACWAEGRFSEDPSSFLLNGWEKTTIGKRVRYRKPGSKPFFEQTVIFDTKTMKGIILTRKKTYFKKLSLSLADVFSFEPDKENILPVLCEHAMIDILRITPSYHLWTVAFDKQDKQKEKKKNSPEQKAMIDTINAAMSDLLPFINSDTNPDWDALAKKHGLDEGGIESVKNIYESVKKQRN